MEVVIPFLFVLKGLVHCFLFWLLFSQPMLSTCKCHWNKIFVSYFISSIYSFKYAGNHGILYFCPIIKESAVFSCWNPFLGAKLCPGCHWLYTRRRHDRFSHIFTSFVWAYFFILLPTNFLPHYFCPALTENTHYRHWREPKSLD